MKTLMYLGAALAQFAMPAVAREIGVDDLGSLPAAQIIVIGEIHDNPVHHGRQAAAVAALQPRALVFEMLTPAQAGRSIPGGTESQLSDAFAWAESGWPDFAMYYPIFAAAPNSAVFGAGIERENLRRLRADGVESVFGPDAGLFGLTTPLEEADQAAREAEQQKAHCDALPPEALPGMVMGQRVRDASLARAALQALQETGGPVVVIAGSGHARHDVGAPAMIALARPDVQVLSVGQTEAAGDPEGEQPFDLWLSAPPAPREDPCAAFRK